MEASLRADVEHALQRWRDATTPPDAAATPMIVCATSSAMSACRAWSRADFVARVASFSVASWFAKPLSISPLACARHGWRNTKRDVVQCSSCERVLCMKIDAKLSPAGAEAVAEKFANQLEDAHEETCPWRHNASPESFTKLPVLGPSQVAQTLLQRVTKLLEATTSSLSCRSALMETSIPDKTVDIVVEKTAFSTKEELALLVQKALPSEDNTDQSLVLTATLLAIGGWGFHGDNDHAAADQIVLRCVYCNRHVPLMAEEPVASSPQASDDAVVETSEPSAKRRKTQNGPSEFDPINGHRWFCPWLVPQRRREADDERLRAVETLLATEKLPQNKPSPLTEFVGLPGWIQNAQAVKLLDVSTKPSSSAARGPRDALASIQSVLALPDSHF